MKYCFLILSFVCYHPVFGQDDFFGVYNKINRTAERQIILLDKVRQNERDTTKAKQYLKLYKKTLQDSILPVAKGVVNLTFPDIPFTGINGKDYSISDFSGKQVIINYNYLYCQGCLNRIDSTLKLIDKTKVQLIVLFLTPYQKEIDDLKVYEDNVVIGFMNQDNERLISLGLGDNSMYYLDEKRRIEFFDKLYPDDHEIAWTNFLKNYKQ